MAINSKTLPDNIRRCMPKEKRKELQAPTQAEADAKWTLKREKELQENIASLLRQRNIVFFRQRMDRKTTGTIGWPDFMFSIKGRAIAIECKMPGVMPTPEQYACMGEMITNGWSVRIIESEQQFLDYLKEMGAQNV